MIRPIVRTCLSESLGLSAGCQKCRACSREQSFHSHGDVKRESLEWNGSGVECEEGKFKAASGAGERNEAEQEQADHLEEGLV